MNLPYPTLFKTMIFGIFTLLISSTLCLGQTKAELIDELVSEYHDYGKFNGSVLVADQGKVLFKKGYGEANMEWEIPNEPNTKHRLGSISKQFTAMLILQLAEEGKLDLQAPITKYLPDYPKENGDLISTHHLLTHTSGIPNYTAFPGFFADQSRDPFTPDEFVDTFKDMELEFSPGERFNYSNSGYFLLGVLIEKLTEKSFEQALHENIFKPLGMNDSGYDNHRDILKNRATGYEKEGKSFVNSNYLDMSIPYAAGSLYSTVEDLYIWDQALYTNKLLSQKYMDLMFEPYIPAFGEFHYAYGWTVGNEVIGNTKDSIYVISHGGGINGFSTYISRAAEGKSLVVLLNNTGGAPLNDMTYAIRGIMNDKSYDHPKKSLADELAMVIETKGIEAGITYFNDNKDSDDLELSEREINDLGYMLMFEDRAEEAAKIFKLNLETFPKSSNVYDSYAEALMTLGQNEDAIKNYKTSVEMNPANQHGIDMLKELGVDTDDLIKEVVVPVEILDAYIGRYELVPGFIITVTKGENNQMHAQATGQPEFDIFPKSNEVFYLTAVEAEISFNKDADGNVESLTLFQGGRETTGKKLQE